jgi:BON domain-containing protein
MHDILLPTNRLIRLRNSFRYPFQSSMLARTPIAGARVPLREFWRRQPPGMTRRSERLLERTMGAASRTGAWCSTAALASADAARAAGAKARTAARGAPRPERSALPLLAAGAAAGALAMYFADPHAGRRRRALVRDRFVHVGHIVTRRLPMRVERRMRFIRGVATGVGHDAAALVHIDGRHESFADDETLVARVRSEVLRDRHVKAGEIHIDAYEGIVTLRGEADSHEIGDLVTATTRVEGVRGVRNYLHTPGSLPPNKADGYAPHPIAADGG